MNALQWLSPWGNADTRTKLSRSGMPDGFFHRNVLWFGDAGSSRVAVSRGFAVEAADLDALDDPEKAGVVDRLRALLVTLGQEYALQARFRVESDFADALERYRQTTDAIRDRWRHRWQIWNRTERYERYRRAMEEKRLRRETLTLFFTRVIDACPPFRLSEPALQRHYDALALREAKAFEEVTLNALQTLFPDARVSILGDAEHYRHYCAFLGSEPHGADDSLSLQANCLGSDVVSPALPGVSFQLGGVNHAVLAMTALPRRAFPGCLSALTGLPFVDYELVLNLYPQPVDRAVKGVEKAANQLEGEVNTNRKKAYSSQAQLHLAQERIEAFERGAVHPFNVFLALRLWHENHEDVISRAGLVKNAFAATAGAACHHATNPETARQLWYQTWPGWTHGDYRGYDQETDDEVAAMLLPWTSSFTGRLDGAEALYDSPKGGLVGVTTRVGGVGQHMIIAGATRGGKSLFEGDLLAQAGHEFGYILIVEEGLSHGVTARALGADPIILSPDAGTTVNYLDPDGGILTNELLAGASNLGLLMLRENGPGSKPADVSRLQACLTRHLNALYDHVWQEWADRHPEEARRAARRALGIFRHRLTLPGKGHSFLDAWASFRDAERADAGRAGECLAALDEGDVARFQTAPETRSLVRNVGLSYLDPQEMPTHGQLCELLSLNPQGDDDAAKMAVELGERLSVWRRNGPYGALFDGASTHRLNGNAVHFELGKIQDAQEELRAAAHFLVLNVAWQQIIKRPRAERKFACFEEGKRVLGVPGGARTISSYYAQLGKYGCVASTVFQQINDLEAADPASRAAILNNAKLFLISAQPTSQAADAAAKALDLSPAATNAVKRFPMPEHQTGQKFSSFLMVAPDPGRKMVGALRNVVSKETFYCCQSDNETWDQKQAALANYDDAVEGILTESRKLG